MIKRYNGFLLEKIKYELLSLLEGNLYASSDFVMKLKSLSKAKGKTGEIANKLIDIIDNEWYLDDNITKQNYFNTTDKDDTVSFIQSNKVPNDWDEEKSPELPYVTKGRNEIKIGKIIRTLSKEMDLDSPITDKDIEDFVNQYKASSSKTTVEFKLVSGDDITKYYDSKRYYSRSGSLGGSCMADESKSTFKLYSENTSKVKMLVLIDNNDKIHGRAIVWKLKESPCEAKYFMDRVYSNSDSDVYKFKQFAEEKGYLYKEFMNSHIETNVNFIYKGKEVVGECSVKLDGAAKNYPFVDTMCFLSKDKETISNIPSQGCFFLHSVSGDCSECDSCNGVVIDCYDCSNDREVYCDDCDGSGDSDSGKCVTCKGTGEVVCSSCDLESGDEFSTDSICSDCGEGLKVLIDQKVNNSFLKNYKSDKKKKKKK